MGQLKRLPIHVAILSAFLSIFWCIASSGQLVINQTISAPGYVTTQTSVTIQAVPVVPPFTMPVFDPATVRLPAQTQPTPAQAWLGITPRDISGELAYNPAGPIIYIDTTGSDANPGTITQPVATWNGAQSKIPNGSGGRALFHRGERHRINNNVNNSGRDGKNVLLLSDYGDPTLPRAQVYNGDPANPSAGSNVIAFGNCSYVVLQNLDIVPPVQSGANLVRCTSNASFICFTGCRIVGNTSSDGVVISAIGGGVPSHIIFDHDVIGDNANGSKCQGAYLSGVQDWIFNCCTFDHNGWTVNNANIFSHNLYVQHDCSPGIFINNISANASCHGAQIRSSGFVAGNLFSYSPNGCLVATSPYSATGQQAMVEWNVVQGPVAASNTVSANAGIEIKSTDAIARHNLFLQNASGVTALAITGSDVITGAPTTQMSVVYANNSSAAWNGLGLGESPANMPNVKNVGGNAWNVTLGPTLDDYAKSIGLANGAAFVESAVADPKVTCVNAVAFVQAGYQAAGK